MRSLLPIILLLSFLASPGCKSTNHGARLQGPQVHVLTYNLENLFDTKDDPGKSDETYLPIGQKQSAAHKAKCKKVPRKTWREQCLNWDWNEDVLHTKMLRLSQALRQVNSGKGPDIVFLQEVENESVLKQWNDTYLADLDYSTLVLIEGTDRRGIDVALLSRFPLKEPPKLHDMKLKDISKDQKKDTRGILEATLLLPDETPLTTFTVHFPAPFHPSSLRRQSFRKLNQLAQALPKDRLILAAGDFNVPAEEDEKEGILNQEVTSQWLVSHRIGCEECKGTYYYPPKKSWSFLDMILLSKNLSGDSSGDGSSWQVDKDSIQVHTKGPNQISKSGYPMGFDLPNPQGVSDHWPLGLSIVKAK